MTPLLPPPLFCCVWSIPRCYVPPFNAHRRSEPSPETRKCAIMCIQDNQRGRGEGGGG